MALWDPAVPTLAASHMLSVSRGLLCADPCLVSQSTCKLAEGSRGFDAAAFQNFYLERNGMSREQFLKVNICCKVFAGFEL